MPFAMSVLRYWLNTEPATAGMVTDAGVDDWSITLRAALRRFRDVSSVEDYVDRAVDVFRGDRPLQTPAAGPVDLTGPIGHLDVVWEIAFGARLFGRLGAEVPATLDREVESASELDSHLSALANVLNQIKVDESSPEVGKAGGPAPEDEGVPLAAALRRARIRRRTDQTIGTLQDIVRIRAARQHADVALQAVERHRRLGSAIRSRAQPRHGPNTRGSPMTRSSPSGKRSEPARDLTARPRPGRSPPGSPTLGQWTPLGT